MKVDVKVTETKTIDITPIEALIILCKTLGMEYVLDEDRDLYVSKYDDSYDLDLKVFETVDCHDECIDDRGKLFVALRNVAANMVPNVLFRNADYIYGD